MQFAYIGDHEETFVFGLTFPRGAPIEVTSDAICRKLASNCDFSQCVDGVEVVQEEPRAKRTYTRRTKVE